jgi:crotonobetainyl-CoA:carnitine CoA-transferase CaiB-like acyl-CoA transferase
MSIQTHTDLAFSGLRVLDVSQGIAGPYCAMLLAQHGAEVIKLEPPTGDWSRGIGARHGSHTAIDLMANQGKKSLVLDMKRAECVAATLRIASQCDVMIEGFRPGVAAKLGISYEHIQAVKADIIYLSVSGFGQTGPRAQQPATDTVVQAFSGMMSLNAEADQRPRKVGFPAVDTLTGLYAFQAVSTALYRHLRSRVGCYLDVSLLQSTAAFLSPKLIENFFEGETPLVINSPAGVYQTQDGWIAITLSKETHFLALCKAIGLEALAADERFTNFENRARHEKFLQDQISSAIRTRKTDAWLACLASFGVLSSPANTVTQWLQDSHVIASRATKLFKDPELGDVLFPAIPGVCTPSDTDSRSRWPQVGEHSRDILQSLGFSPQEIENLIFKQPTK